MDQRIPELTDDVVPQRRERGNIYVLLFWQMGRCLGCVKGNIVMEELKDLPAYLKASNADGISVFVSWQLRKLEYQC